MKKQQLNGRSKKHSHEEQLPRANKNLQTIDLREALF